MSSSLPASICSALFYHEVMLPSSPFLTLLQQLFSVVHQLHRSVAPACTSPLFLETGTSKLLSSSSILSFSKTVLNSGWRTFTASLLDVSTPTQVSETASVFLTSSFYSWSQPTSWRQEPNRTVHHSVVQLRIMGRGLKVMLSKLNICCLLATARNSVHEDDKQNVCQGRSSRVQHSTVSFTDGKNQRSL